MMRRLKQRCRPRSVAILALAALVTGACTSGVDSDAREQGSGDSGVGGFELPQRLEPWFATPSDPPVTRLAGDWFESACGLPLEYLRRIRRGYYPGRSQDVMFVPRDPNFMGEFDYTTHGGAWDYLERVPLVFYGPGYIKAQGEIELSREVTVADIAPTVAELLGFDWGGGRPGRAISEALVPEAERSKPPKLVLTVVWDGGGSDVLDAWPDAWPNLANLMAGGTSIGNATVGSAPSVTPPIHANIGTGAFPKQHGIIDLTQRSGERVTDSYVSLERDFSPKNLELSTLADDYDLATGNASKVGVLAYRGWHLGMMGHGAFSAGGDKDIAAIIDRQNGDIITSDRYYSLPDFMNEIPGLGEDIQTADATDGKIDSKWLGRVPLDDPDQLQYTPAWTLYETRLLKALLERENVGRDDVPDLYFVNYKQIDDVGHFYNMLSEEMNEILQFSDDALSDVTKFLDERIGARNWVMVFTADHGETPDPSSTGGWPIDVQTLADKTAAHFDLSTNDMILSKRTMGFWFDKRVLATSGISAEDIADFMVDYRLDDSVQPGHEIPERYIERAQEPVFEAAFPMSELGRVWGCAKRRAR